MFTNPKAKTKEINDKTFQIYLLPAGEGISIAQKLSQLVLPLIDTGNDEMEVDFVKIASGLSASLGDNDLLTLIKRLLKELSVDGTEISFDEYFMGNYGELIAVLAFALKENFGSFFDGLAILGN